MSRYLEKHLSRRVKRLPFAIASCQGKRRYPDRQVALDQIRRTLTQGRKLPLPLRTYACTLCNGWHLAK